LVHEKRFFASIIDVGIVLVISLILKLFIPAALFNNELIFLVLYLLVSFVYMSTCLLITKDKTIGLYSVSLRLLNKNWDKINKKVIFIRAISHGVPILYLVNILYMLLNKSENTFFDDLSDSMIIKTGDDFFVKETRKVEDKEIKG